MVPDGWRSVLLGEITEGGFRNGYSPNAPDTPTDRFVLSLSALTPVGFDATALKPAPEDQPVLRSELRVGDFLISRSNTRDRVGFTAMFRGEVQNCSYPDLMMRFRPSQREVVPEFLEQALRSRRTLGYLQGAAAGTSGSMVKLNSSTVAKAPVSLPPLPEQRKIAEILSTWDRAIETTEALLANARTQKRALMQSLLTGKRRFPEFEGQEWREVPLGDACELVNGRGFKPHEWADEGYPIIRIQNLNGSPEFNFFNGDFSPKIFVRPGDLLFAWSGSRGTSFGPHRWEGPEAVLNYHTWRVVPKDTIVPNFLYQYLQFITTKIEAKAHGASALVHTQKREMEKLQCSLPSLREQLRISEALDQFEAQVDLLRANLDKQTQEKKALMQQLLTGKRRVKTS